MQYGETCLITLCNKVNLKNPKCAVYILFNAVTRIIRSQSDRITRVLLIFPLVRTLGCWLH